MPVEPQVFELLRYLIERRGEVVRKEEILDEVWGDRFVSESALTSRVKSARRAVGDDGTAQRVIRTVHGRGYEFVAAVDSSVTVDLSHAAGADLDVYVLHPDCAGEACLAGGDTSITFDAEQDKHYTVVVDGRDEAAALYELTVSCVP